MIAAGADDGPDGTVSADALQAIYFRIALADERERIARIVADSRDELARLIAVGMTPGTQGPRSRVHALEAELRYLDGLIAGLDRRFPKMWIEQRVDDSIVSAIGTEND